MEDNDIPIEEEEGKDIGSLEDIVINLEEGLEEEDEVELVMDPEDILDGETPDAENSTEEKTTYELDEMLDVDEPEDVEPEEAEEELEDTESEEVTKATANKNGSGKLEEWVCDGCFVKVNKEQLGSPPQCPQHNSICPSLKQVG